MQEWANRADLPAHVVTMLKNFPSTLHPMAQFSAAITACNQDSKFRQAYSDGVKKALYWEVWFRFFEYFCTICFFGSNGFWLRFV